MPASLTFMCHYLNQEWAILDVLCCIHAQSFYISLPYPQLISWILKISKYAKAEVVGKAYNVTLSSLGSDAQFFNMVDVGILAFSKLSLEVKFYNHQLN